MKKHLFLLFIAVSANICHVKSQDCIYGDCVNGLGEYIFENDDYYLGEWKDGVRTGLGCYDWAWGAYYYGYFAGGKLDGRGFYIDTLSTGANDLLGNFKNGELITTETFPASGCLLGNCTNGVGIYQWENGDIFLGQWVNGYRTGLGRYDWANGSLYIGYLKDNLLDGYGDYFPVDGDVQSGVFEKGVFMGETDDEEYYEEY